MIVVIKYMQYVEYVIIAVVLIIISLVIVKLTKRDFNIETSTFFDSKKISVSLNRFLGFCEDVTGKAESALCYYSGELNEEDKTDKSKVPLSNNAFVNPA